MPLEIAFSGSLACFNSFVMSSPVGRSIAERRFSQKGLAYVEGSILVPTFPVPVPLGQVTNPHWAFFANANGTTVVRGRYGPNGSELIEMQPGEPAIMPLNSTITQPSIPAGVGAGAGGAGTNPGVGSSFIVYYTFVMDSGAETTVGFSASQPFATIAGQTPQVGLPNLPVGVSSIRIYLSDGTGAQPRLYATGVTTTTFNLSAPLPAVGAGSPPLVPIGPYLCGYGSGPTLCEYLILAI